MEEECKKLAESLTNLIRQTVADPTVFAPLKPQEEFAESLDNLLHAFWKKTKMDTWRVPNIYDY